MGVFIDGSYWFHMHFYWLHHHPQRTRLSIDGVMDAMRWHAHQVLGLALEDVTITTAHYVEGGSVPHEFQKVLDRANIKCHTTGFDPRKQRASGVAVELALTCYDEAFYDAEGLDVVVLIAGSDDYRPLVERLVDYRVMVIVPQIDATWIDGRSGRVRHLVTSPHLAKAATHAPTVQDLVDTASKVDGYPLASPLLRGADRNPVRRK